MVWMRVLGVCLDERRCIDCSQKGMKNMGFWYSGRVGDCMAACIRLYFCSLFFHAVNALQSLSALVLPILLCNPQHKFRYRLVLPFFQSTIIA